MKNIYILAALIGVGLGLYFTPLHHASFYFDDRTAILQNEAIKTLDIPKIFNAFNTRFLVGLSFALNYKWCGLNPFGFRLVNLLIHCLNAFLVYLLVKNLDPRPPREASGGRQKHSGMTWMAFFASLLFLCHPIQTEAVNSMTQRFVLMGSFFYLLAFYLYSVFVNEAKRSFYISSLIAAIAAMFCKEFTITLPLMLTIYQFWYSEQKEGSSKKSSDCPCLLPFFAAALIVPTLLLRTPHETIRAANIAAVDTHHIDITRAKNSISRGEYFLTELNVVRTYIRLLFLPIHQNFDYDYPISTGWNAKTLLSGLFLLALLALAIAVRKKHKIISFGILWFFIALSVESSFIPIGHVIAEYRAYLASVGFILAITTFCHSRASGNPIMIIILIICAILTFQRNKIWKDEFSLWNDTVHQSPHKARPYNNRGLEYFHQGKFPEAAADFNKAIELKPDYAAAYNNLGVLCALKGDLKQAVSDFNKAITLKPDYADARNNLKKALGKN
jgi:tetratricopeptide (TPR) repeat protein